MAPSVHVQAAERSFGNEAGAGEAAIPPAMSELPGRLTVVVAAGDVRIAKDVVLDRDDLGRALDVDAHPAGVLAIKEVVVFLPLRFELQAPQGEPEGFVWEGDGVDAPALRMNRQQPPLDVEVTPLGIDDPAAAKAIAEDERRPDDVGRVRLGADNSLDDRGREGVRGYVALLGSGERAGRVSLRAALSYSPFEEVDSDGAHLRARARRALAPVVIPALAQPLRTDRWGEVA